MPKTKPKVKRIKGWAIEINDSIWQMAYNQALSDAIEQIKKL